MHAFLFRPLRLVQQPYSWSSPAFILYHAIADYHKTYRYDSQTRCPTLISGAPRTAYRLLSHVLTLLEQESLGEAMGHDWRDD